MNIKERILDGRNGGCVDSSEDFCTVLFLFLIYIEVKKEHLYFFFGTLVNINSFLRPTKSTIFGSFRKNEMR